MSKKAGTIFVVFTYFWQNLPQCQAHIRSSINIAWMKEVELMDQREWAFKILAQLANSPLKICTNLSSSPKCIRMLISSHLYHAGHFVVVVVLPNQNFKNIIDSNLSSSFFKCLLGLRSYLEMSSKLQDDKSNHHPRSSLNILYHFYLNIWFLQNSFYCKVLLTNPMF